MNAGDAGAIRGALNQSGLDESQLKFCTLPGKMVRLLAPAGSGKTLSLLWRCLHAWEGDPEHNQRFLVFTFTRMACQELQDRLRTLPAFAPIRESVEVSTLNSWGFRRLKQKSYSPRLCTSDIDKYFCVKNVLQPVWRQHAAIESLIQNQTVRGPKAVMALMDELKSLGFRHDTDIDFEAMSKHLQWLQSSGLGVHIDTMLLELGELEVIDSHDASQPLMRQFYDKVFCFWRDACTQLSDAAMFTLEDQKYWPLLMLDAQLKEGRYTTGTQRIHHILVDEFQDINVLDLNLLKTIAKLNKTVLTIVGDDDQAIYEWRGATPRFIVSPDTYVQKGYETCTLEVNYRSPRNIVAISQKLIKHNKNRVDKNVRALSTKDADVRVLRSKTLNDTVDYVCGLVKQLLDDPAFARVAVVARKRSQIIPYQIVFASDDTPFYAAEDLNVLLSNAFKELRDLLLIRARANTSSRPTSLGLSHELRLKLLEGLGLSDYLLFEPLDGRRLVGNEELELKNIADGHTLLVVLRYLLRKEIHPISF
jgi:DNA helicase-2/ATP-dependent DNA helicase PcrA